MDLKALLTIPFINLIQRNLNLSNQAWKSLRLVPHIFLIPEEMSKPSSLPLVKYLIIAIIFLLQMTSY